MALAPLAHVLFTRILRHDPSDPDWPDRDRFVLSNGHASILLYSMLYLTGYGLTLDDLARLPQLGQPDPGAPRGPPHRGRRGHHRPARPGRGQRRRHGRGRAVAAHPLRARARRPPHLRRRRRRLPRGGHLPRGGLAGRPPRTRTPGLRLRRQPHHHRRSHRAGPRRRRRRAVRAPTAGTSRTSARSPTTSTRSRRPCCRARADEDRPSLIILRSHIGYPSPESHRHGQGPRRPVLRRGGPAHQGDPRAPRRHDLLGARRRARPCTAPPSRAARPCGPSGRRASTAWDGDRARFDAALGGHGLPGWESTLPAFTPEDGPMATRKAIKACLDATARPASRAPAGQRRPDRQHRHGTGRRHRPVGRGPRRQPRSTTASASTPWGRS